MAGSPQARMGPFSKQKSGCRPDPGPPLGVACVHLVCTWRKVRREVRSSANSSPNGPHGGHSLGVEGAEVAMVADGKALVSAHCCFGRQYQKGNQSIYNHVRRP